jgi:ABC-type phosphate transport system permease subunit
VRIIDFLAGKVWEPRQPSSFGILPFIADPYGLARLARGFDPVSEFTLGYTREWARMLARTIKSSWSFSRASSVIYGLFSYIAIAPIVRVCSAAPRGSAC